MKLALEPDRPAGEALRRVLLRLARSARRDLERLPHDSGARIHRIRTTMKKYRSLLRLARPELGRKCWKAALQHVRLLKDGLAGSRDQAVIYQTVRRLLGEAVTQRFEVVEPAAPVEAVAPEELLTAAKELAAFTERLRLKKLSGKKLRKRWWKTWRKACRARDVAEATGGAEAFHAWRKRIKDLWYQGAALQALDADIGKTLHAAKQLSDALGGEHDITMAIGSMQRLGGEERGKLANNRDRLRRLARRRARRLSELINQG